MFKKQQVKRYYKGLERLVMHRQSKKQQKNIGNIRHRTYRRLKRSIWKVLKIFIA